MRIGTALLGLGLAAAGLALPAQAPSGLRRADLMAQILGGLKDRPEASIAAARTGLAKDGSLVIEDFEAGKDRPAALDLARKGVAASPAGSIQMLEFTALAAGVLSKDGKPQEGQEELKRLSPLMDALARSEDPESRYQAAQGFRMLGEANLAMRRLPEAMEGFTQAIQLFDGLKDAQGQAFCLASMGRLQFQSGHYDEAVRLVKQAIQTAKDGAVKGAQSANYLSLGNIYAHIDGKVGEEFEALQMAREAALVEGNDYNLAVVVTNLADVALQEKDYHATLQYAGEAIPLVQKSGDKLSLAVCWVNKGIAMNRLGQAGGMAFILKAAETFKALDDKDDQAEIQGVLADEYAFNREWAKAYAAEAEFKNRTDALRKEADQRRIAETEAAYQTDLKQRQIEDLQKQRHADRRVRLLWILAALMALCAALALIVSRRRLKKANQALEDMSLHDPLTGLPNRRYLATRVEEDLAQVRRLHRAVQGAPPLNSDVIFMMIDIDHFKAINDTHGHAAGDEVLRQFSQALSETLRDSDTVVRWGGEEFLILAKHASRGDARLLAERVRVAVAQRRFELADGTPLRRTCSIGFACYPFLPAGTPSPSWEAVVSLADQCLYAAKASGRDMWAGLIPDLKLRTAVPEGLSARRGVEEGLFELVCSEGREVAWAGG